MPKNHRQRELKNLGNQVELTEKGRGIVFDIRTEDFSRGFVIRYLGNIYAYRNQCPHTGVELDWVEGKFFDTEKKYISCSTHGALFDVVTGKCVYGPCLGQSLQPLAVFLRHGDIVVDLAGTPTNTSTNKSD